MSRLSIQDQIDAHSPNAMGATEHAARRSHDSDEDEGFILTPKKQSLKNVAARLNPYKRVVNEDTAFMKAVGPGQARFVSSAEGRAAVVAGVGRGHCVTVFLPGKGMVCTHLKDVYDAAAARLRMKKFFKLIKEQRDPHAPVHARTIHPWATAGEIGDSVKREAALIHGELQSKLKLPAGSMHADFRHLATTTMPDHGWNFIADPRSGRIREVKIQLGSPERMARSMARADNFMTTFGTTVHLGAPSTAPLTAQLLSSSQRTREPQTQDEPRLPPYKLEQKKKGGRGSSSRN